MKIAFDQQVFLLQEYGGISRYFCSLVKALCKIESIEPRIIAPLHFNRILQNENGVSKRGIFLPKLSPKLFRSVLMTGTFLARRSIQSFRPDILHETYFSGVNYRPAGAKIVLTIYDMVHEKFSESFDGSSGTTAPKKIAAQRADHIICISESTRKDLIDICGISREKTSVIYLGVDDIFSSTPQEIDLQLNLPENFLFYVGKRDGYKNFDGFLKAFAALTSIKKEFSIVCFGGGAFTPSELAVAKDAGLRPGQLVHYAGGDDLLAAIYRQAYALVYPSTYEGFGLPPLEAMSSGCPVICSNTSSLPEVVGDAGEYFDPLHQDSMMRSIENVLTSPKRHEGLRDKGFTQASKFSWSKCAEETMREYQKLL